MTAKTILPVLLLVVAINFLNIDGAAVVDQRHFTYMGSYRKIAKNDDGEGGGFYYLGKEDIQWETAVADCKEIFNASLVSLETPEEAELLGEALIISGSAGILAWSSGKYDEESQHFKWATGDVIDENAPWEIGQPSHTAGSARIFLRANETEGIGLGARFNTEKARYLCEISDEK